jgi:Protein of unknown function (DUF3489)
MATKKKPAAKKTAAKREAKGLLPIKKAAKAKKQAAPKAIVSAEAEAANQERQEIAALKERTAKKAAPKAGQPGPKLLAEVINKPIKELRAAKAAKAKGHEAKGPRPGSKTAMLLELLSGKGSTVEKMCERLGWQAHTLRAALTRLPNGAKAERSREDGVTSYKLA